MTLTHEVIHCYQYQVIDDVYLADMMPPWISEGSAIWLAGNDTGIVEPMVPGLWRKFIMGMPQNPLTLRTYDAYGWYALLDHLGRPMWSLVAEAWRAAARSINDQPSAAFIAGLDGDARDVQAAWAPLHARETSWSDPWVPYGLGLPADARAPRIEVKATVDGYRASLPDRSNRVYTVTGSDGEVVVVETDGLASAHDGALDSALAFTSRRFCVDGDCICPPGTQRAGEHLADEAMHLPFVVAFQAPAGGAHQRISSKTMEQECGRDERSPAPSDQRHADRSRAGTSRHAAAGNARAASAIPTCGPSTAWRTTSRPPGSSRCSRHPMGRSTSRSARSRRTASERGIVSNNTAVAARVGDHRVGVYSRRRASSCAWTA